jgi:predicted rRNA methylase YqxC with S4 and FtsJ domains
VWQRVLEEVTAALLEGEAAIMGVMASPLTGADGNVEFLVHARAGTTEGADVDDAVARAITEAGSN